MRPLRIGPSFLVFAFVCIVCPVSVGALTTVDFEGLTGLAGEQFGFAAGQPFASLGLTMRVRIIDDPTPDIGSDSEGIALRSAAISAGGNTNVQRFSFDTGQQAVGFFSAFPVTKT